MYGNGGLKSAVNNGDVSVTVKLFPLQSNMSVLTKFFAVRHSMKWSSEYSLPSFISAKIP